MHAMSKIAALIVMGAWFIAASPLGSGSTFMAPEAKATARPAAFAVCAACHSIEPGKTIVGPSLAGIGGRKAASLPNFAYSDALKKSGLTWNAANLDKWLTSPQKTVPGTKMPFTGLANPDQRKDVIAYLMTL